MTQLTTTIFQASLFMAGLVSSSVVLADDGAPMQVVNVSGVSNHDERSYSKIIQGMDLFEKHHAMAPAASLRFELVPLRAKSAVKDLTLRIVGSEQSIPIALAEDMSFAVPRLPAMLTRKAMLRSNRRVDSLLWRARIRTPGLPANTRRLGDLRLEWHVDYVSNLATHWITPGSALVMATMDRPYEMRGVHHVFLADRALFGITMIAGKRSQVIEADLLYGSGLFQALPSPILALWKDRNFLKDRAFDLPLWDASWPDDTLVVIEYMDDGGPATASVPSQQRLQ